MDELICRNVCKQHQESDDENNIPPLEHKSIDAVVGGDHGQGSFCAGTRVTLRDENKQEVSDDAWFTGKIECEKDNCELLHKLLAPKANDALQKMVECKRDPAANETVDDGQFNFFKCTQTNDCHGAFGREPHKRNADDIGVCRVPIRVTVTGDLAFCATMLGKESSNRDWC